LLRDRHRRKIITTTSTTSTTTRPRRTNIRSQITNLLLAMNTTHTTEPVLRTTFRIIRTYTIPELSSSTSAEYAGRGSSGGGGVSIRAHAIGERVGTVFGGSATVSILGTAFGGERTLSVAPIAIAACSCSCSLWTAAKVGVGVGRISPWFGLFVIVIVHDLCHCG